MTACWATFTFDFHEHLSLLSLGFVALHVLVLMLDTYEPFSLTDILVPFVSHYRPLWVGIGIIGMYLSLLVTVTFYIRNFISMKAFRQIHYLSMAAYIGVTLHGLYSGTDSTLAFMQNLYAGTSLSIVFLCVYWLIMLRLRKREVSA